MISRLTACAAAFAILATASLALAANSHQSTAATPGDVKKKVRVVQLERVVIIGKRSEQAPR